MVIFPPIHPQYLSTLFLPRDYRYDLALPRRIPNLTNPGTRVRTTWPLHLFDRLLSPRALREQ